MNQNIIKGLLVAAIWCSNILVLQAAQDNIAPRAHVTVSNVLNENYAADNLVDGKIMYDDKGEWACKGSVTSWGVMYTPWAQLEWDEEVCVDRVVLYVFASLITGTPSITYKGSLFPLIELVPLIRIEVPAPG